MTTIARAPAAPGRRGHAMRAAATAAFALLSFAASPRAAVTINEFVSNPAGSDAGLEWVELYNDGPADVNLSGWLLQRDVNGVWTGTGTAVIALSGTVAAKGFFLIEDLETATTASADLIVTTAAPLGLGNASSKSEGLRLLEGAEERDRVVYGTPDSDGIGAEGTPAGEPGEAASLARGVDGRDRQNNAADFFEDATPTPRAANDPLGVVRLDVSGSISYPNPFAPAVHPFVTITTPERVLAPLREIRVYNVAGELVRTLFAFTWDGLNDEGRPVSTGLYFYVLETEAGKARGKVTVVR